MARKSFNLGFVLLVFLTIMACAQTQQYTPRLVSYSYQLAGLPSNIVEVQVNDLRTETPASDTTKDVLKSQISLVLSSQPSPTIDKRFKLIIDIIEHRSFFTLGNWNASTYFRVKLININGGLVDQWDALGTAHRSNMSGYATAEAVSQDSYNIAVADMMSSLSQVSVRE